MLVNAALMLLASLLIAWTEIPKLRRNRLWKELWSFVALLAVGTAAAIAIIMHAPLPNPLDGISAVLSPLSEFVRQLLT